MGDISIDNSFLLDILKSGPASIVIIDKNNLDIEYCNEGFIENFCEGVSNYKEAIPSMTAMLDTDQQERLKAQLQEVTDKPLEKHKYVVYRLLWKGVIKVAYIYAAPLRPHDTASDLYQLFIIRDFSKSGLPFISFDTRDLFFKQMSSMDFGTFEWILAQDKIFWTDGVYDIYEIEKPRKDFSFAAIAKCLHPDDRPRVDAAMSAAFRDGQEIDVEYRIITEKNNLKNVHVLAKVIYTSDGKKDKLIGSIRDITSQRKTEEELRDTVKILNRSNKDLEEFAYVASHDLQEPLRKISTFSDRLNEKYKDVLSGDGAMYLNRIMASAENMRTLINNLLEFSRITKSVIPFAPTNLNFILQQVKTELELKIEETGTLINSAQLPTINASVTQMKQLFGNIINNAIKFRKPDITPTIDIQSTPLSREELLQHKLADNINYHKIQITDNGIGFEDEYATRIFQIFQRLHGKTEYPGSGIGLAICQKIMEHHSGIIYAENIPDTGARFTFIVPERQPVKLN